MTRPSEPPPVTPVRDAAGASRPASVRIGFAVFLIGLIFLVVTVVPFFWGQHDRPVWLNAGCMLAPLGFVIAVVGVIRAGRADQRSVLQRLQARE